MFPLDDLLIGATAGIAAALTLAVLGLVGVALYKAHGKATAVVAGRRERRAARTAAADLRACQQIDALGPASERE